MATQLTIRRYDSLTSTSSQAAALGDEAVHGTVVVTDCQTSGRGQRGNSWEAEPGMNLTFSLVLRPHGLAPARQFELSMASALALVRVLEKHIGDAAGPVKLKWPNDIYVGNCKISGTLIENVITSTTIERSIAGIGINVNQTEFRSDAPNPVSMAQLCGHTFNLGTLLTEFSQAVVDAVDAHLLSISEGRDAQKQLVDAYKRCLWRNDGNEYRWLDAATGQTFMAQIDDVGADGMLRLRTADGQVRTFAFKEVAAVL